MYLIKNLHKVLVRYPQLVSFKCTNCLHPTGLNSTKLHHTNVFLLIGFLDCVFLSEIVWKNIPNYIDPLSFLQCLSHPQTELLWLAVVGPLAHVGSKVKHESSFLAIVVCQNKPTQGVLCSFSRSFQLCHIKGFLFQNNWATFSDMVENSQKKASISKVKSELQGLIQIRHHGV